jgi:hypothetical protein
MAERREGERAAPRRRERTHRSEVARDRGAQLGRERRVSLRMASVAASLQKLSHRRFPSGEKGAQRARRATRAQLGRPEPMPRRAAISAKLQPWT